MKLVTLFVIVVILSACAHIVLWQYFDFVDKSMWIHHIDQLNSDELGNANILLQTYPAGPLVGTALMSMRIFGATPPIALIGTLIFINAVVIGLSVVITYLMFQKSYSWIAVWGLLVVNDLYTHSTPPSILVIPLLVLLVLLSLYIYRIKEKVNIKYLSLWVLVFGLALSTRYDISLYIGFGMIIILFKKVGWRKILMMISTAVLVAFIANAYTWIVGLSHYNKMFELLVFHYSDYDQVIWLSPLNLLSALPLAMVGIVVCVGSIFISNRLNLIPPKFIIYMLLITVIFTGIIFTSNLQSIRYFYPLAFIWEILLAITVFELLPLLSAPIGLPTFLKKNWLTSLSAMTMIVLVGGNLVMVLHLYYLPSVTVPCLPQGVADGNYWQCE